MGTRFQILYSPKAKIQTEFVNCCLYKIILNNKNENLIQKN